MDDQDPGMTQAVAGESRRLVGKKGGSRGQGKMAAGVGQDSTGGGDAALGDTSDTEIEKSNYESRGSPCSQILCSICRNPETTGGGPK